MKLWATLLTGCLLTLLAVTARAADGRFSQSLATEDRVATGVMKLSSDQVAVLDALVRRDFATRTSTRAAANASARFSERLTADEHRIAGFALLTEAELVRLDAAVDKSTSAAVTRALLAPPAFLSPTRVRPTEAKEGGEIHGSFSLSYGVGKGGYSEKSGSMVLNYEDPARRFMISVGYTETHTKSPYLYRDDPRFYSPRELPEFSPKPVP